MRPKFKPLEFDIDTPTPSVDELLEQLAVDMDLRRPHDWKSIVVRPELNYRCCIPIGTKLDARNLTPLLVKCCPSCRQYLENEMTRNKGVRVELQITKSRVFGTSYEMRVCSSITDRIAQSCDPHTDPLGNLKGFPESVADNAGEKYLPVTSRVIGNNRALKGKRS